MLSKNVQLHHMTSSFATLKVAQMPATGPRGQGRLAQGKTNFDAIARIEAARFAVMR